MTATDSGASRLPWLAAVLSAVLPGAGQWYAGRRRRAVWFLVVAGVATIGVVWLASRGSLWLLRTFVQPRWLWVLFAANLVVAVVRVLATIGAYRAASGRWPTRLAGAGVAALSLVVLIPHVVVGDYSLEAIHTIESVFVTEEQAPLAEREAQLIASGVDPSDLGPTTTVATAPTFTPRPGMNSDEGKERIPYEDRYPVEPVIVPTESSAWEAPFTDYADRFGTDHFTVLLAGGDAGPGRWSLRTDVMIVASVDLTTNRAVLFSISRDMAEAALPTELQHSFLDMELDYAWRQEKADAAAEDRDPVPVDPATFRSCGCFPDRLNAIWTYTNTFVRTYPDSPDPGMEALRRTLSIMLGIPIDYYVLVDFAGFVDLVDAIGGIDVTLANPIDVAYSPAKEGEEPVSISLGAGTHHVDGRTALAYVRDRSLDNDAARMRRQRCLLRSVADAADVGTLVAKFPAIAEAVRTSTTTNIPLSVAPDLIEIAASLDASNIATQAIGYPQHTTGINWKGLPLVDRAKVQATVQATLAAAADPASTAGFSADECG